MPCTSCSSSPIIVNGLNSILSQVSVPCSNCPTFLDSKCIYYNGPNLSCSGINTGDTLEDAIQKIDTLLCANAGDFSTYNTYCLSPINTQQEFVESISQYVCNTQTSLTTFTGTTFPAYQTSVNTRFVAIEVPATTSSCSQLTITNTDTLQAVLQKLSNGICAIYGTALDLSGVAWNTCFSVGPIPTTVPDAFSVIVSQICNLQTQINNGGGNALPIFDNTGSCLTGGTSTDTLVDTVNLIKTRLCQTGTYDGNAVTWGCITPSVELQDGVQNIVTALTAVQQKTVINFSGDFSVTPVGGDPCQGLNVALATPSSQDRFVAATSTDASPGTLQDKLVNGSGYTWDFTTPTQALLVLDAVTGSCKVMTDSGDDSCEYLQDKLESGTANGITILPTLDSSSSSHKIKLTPSLDLSTLFLALINQASIDPTVKSALCALIASCPSPCTGPTNVSVTYTAGPTPTTTTTTTTSSTTTTTTT